MHLHPSTKSDHYLTLCLEQATLSPLNYRHGAVIVKGGKVIGSGFNDYRPGFNSGALKTGALSLRASQPPGGIGGVGADGGSGAASKKNKTSSSAAAAAGASTASSLSMHSEMMAIHAALGSKAAASVRGSIRGARAPSRVAVEEYVEAVLRAAMPPTASGAGGATTATAVGAAATAAASLHERSERTELATGTGRSNNRKNGDKPKSPSGRSDTSGDDDTSDNSDATSGGGGSGGGGGPGRRQAAERRARQQRDDRSASRQRSPAACHVPKAKRSVQHRMRHPRLAGADLYVARLGKPRPPCSMETASAAPSAAAVAAAAAAAAATAAAVPKKASAAATASTGSLHDELISKEPKPSPSPCASPGSSTTSGKEGAAATASYSARRVAESRPCYRCIAYMHAVGIKRVFWTNGDGVWEGAKVRDLMDSLEVSMDGGGGGSGSGNTGGGNGIGGSGSGGSGGGGGGGSDLGMFVTKHEVLLLLRALAEG